MKMKKTAALLASVIAANSMLAVPFSTSAAEIKIEAESGKLTGTGGPKSDVSGYSGDGYIYLENNSDVLDIPVSVETAGMYELSICYQNNFGSDKIQNISINGMDAGQMSFPETDEWKTLKFGSVKLNEGENTISIVGSWGWTNFDYIILQEAELSPIKATQTSTCDPDAIDSAKQVMAYFASVYGKHVISGQQEIYAGGPHGFDTEFEYIEDLTGKLPAIRGFDYGNFCCPAYGSDDGTTDRIIAWAARGGLVTACYHLNVPTDFASYTAGSHVEWDQTTYSEKCDFSPSKAATEGTKENAYYTQSLDTLAAEFLKLQDKGIPVIWRPLHEAEGGGGETGSWFWWGREGSKAYRELWIYTFKYLTETKGVHNLIWEWNSYNYGTSADWYPGDSYVDIIGYDKYNCTVYLEEDNWAGRLVHNDSAISSTFYGIMEKYNSAKMVAMAECDNVPTLNNFVSEKAGWLYFCPWYDGGKDNINFVSNPIFNVPEDLKEIYQSEYCITLDELPKFSDIEIDPDATNPVENTEPVEPEKGHGKVTLDEKTGDYTITIPEPSDTIYLKVELSDGAAAGANGCIANGFEKDGTYYWVSAKWTASKSGEVKINIDDDFYNMTYNGEDGDPVEVEDEDLIAEGKEYLKSIKSFTGQVWWAGDDTSNAKIIDAYLKKDAAQDQTEPDTSETEGSTTQDNPKVTLYGDVDCNGKVEILDVVILNKSLMIGTPLSEQGRINADVDNSDPTNPDEADALNILKAVVEIVTLPIKQSTEQK